MGGNRTVSHGVIRPTEALIEWKYRRGYARSLFDRTCGGIELSIVCLGRDTLPSYAGICRAISRSARRVEKGRTRLDTSKVGLF